MSQGLYQLKKESDEDVISPQLLALALEDVSRTMESTNIGDTYKELNLLKIGRWRTNNTIYFLRTTSYAN